MKSACGCGACDVTAERPGKGLQAASVHYKASCEAVGGENRHSGRANPEHLVNALITDAVCVSAGLGSGPHRGAHAASPFHFRESDSYLCAYLQEGVDMMQSRTVRSCRLRVVVNVYFKINTGIENQYEVSTSSICVWMFSLPNQNEAHCSV